MVAELNLNQLRTLYAIAGTAFFSPAAEELSAGQTPPVQGGLDRIVTQLGFNEKCAVKGLPGVV
jgi:hypothetical protein